MTIRIARMEDVDQCADIIFSSELGKNYFPGRRMIVSEVEKGIGSDAFYVATGMVCCSGGVLEQNEVTGFIWYQQEGMFHSYPYLHMIAVRDDMRGKGIGTELMDFLESNILEKGKNHIRTRVFLTVADFNPGAEIFYSRRGYEKLCEIPDLFRKNITERVMVKTVAARR